MYVSLPEPEVYIDGKGRRYEISTDAEYITVVHDKRSVTFSESRHFNCGAEFYQYVIDSFYPHDLDGTDDDELWRYGQEIPRR